MIYSIIALIKIATSLTHDQQATFTPVFPTQVLQKASGLLFSVRSAHEPSRSDLLHRDLFRVVLALFLQSSHLVVLSRTPALYKAMHLMTQYLQCLSVLSRQRMGVMVTLSIWILVWFHGSCPHTICPMLTLHSAHSRSRSLEVYLDSHKHYGCFYIYPILRVSLTLQICGIVSCNIKCVTNYAITFAFLPTSERICFILPPNGVPHLQVLQTDRCLQFLLLCDSVSIRFPRPYCA